MVCDGFFTVLATHWQHEGCAPLFNRVHEKLVLLSAQMEALNTTLDVFATRRGWHEQLECDFCLPRVRVVDFDPDELLTRHNFSSFEARRVASTWRGVDTAIHRSDVLRVLIARERQLAYLDTDIAFVNEDATQYLQGEFVAAAVWDSDTGQLEITNSAFCLGPAWLDVLIREQKRAIHAGGDVGHFFCTELAGHALMQIMLNGPPTEAAPLPPPRLLSQNHPFHGTIRDILHQWRRFQHRFLHIPRGLQRSSPLAPRGTYSSSGSMALVHIVRAVFEALARAEDGISNQSAALRAAEGLVAFDQSAQSAVPGAARLPSSCCRWPSPCATESAVRSSECKRRCGGDAGYDATRPWADVPNKAARQWVGRR